MKNFLAMHVQSFEITERIMSFIGDIHNFLYAGMDENKFITLKMSIHAFFQ